MVDLIKDLKEISNKCDSYGNCWDGGGNCPMYLTNSDNPINTRCAFKLLMYMLSDGTPNNWQVCLEEVDEILGKGKTE